MALVTSGYLLSKIQDKNLAIGAFNVHNMDYTQAVVRAAEMENAPVILMLGEPILKYANLDMLSTIALFAAKQSTQEIAVALDHGKTPEIIERSIELGLSIMVDGSRFPYEENIRFTKYYVDMAHAKGLSVEGELGSLSGIEDVEDETASEHLTDPRMVEDFVKRTGVDCLAIAIGNTHGKYLRPPVLDFERLKKIHKAVSVPLVMHGGSDLPPEMSRTAINEGIRKFNIGTDLKYAMCTAMRDTLSQDPMPFQPQDTFGTSQKAVTEVTVKKIHLFKNGMEYV